MDTTAKHHHAPHAVGPEADLAAVRDPLDGTLAFLKGISEAKSLSDREARRQIQVVESDRRAFLLKYFHSEFANPADYDLVVETRGEPIHRAIKPRSRRALPVIGA